jgi:hypothetical protein
MLDILVSEVGLQGARVMPFVGHQADDGLFYLHVLWHLQMLLDVLKERNYEPAGSAQQLAWYAKMGEMIQRRFDESVDTPPTWVSQDGYNILASIGKLSYCWLTIDGGAVDATHRGVARKARHVRVRRALCRERD